MLPRQSLRRVAVRFKVETALLSARPRVGGLTVVVSGALNRLHMVEATCAGWVGPLAVAVLLPVLPPDVQNAEDADGHVPGAALRSLMPRCPAFILTSPACTASRPSQGSPLHQTMATCQNVVSCSA